MNNLLKSYRLSKELKKLAKENAAQGRPLCVMDDIVFKTVLASDTEDSREALRLLLCACTRREVAGVQIKNSEQLPAHLNAKPTRLDIHVTFNDGETANLEMQIDRTDDDLRNRSVIYTSMLIAGQTRKGHDYRGIKRVYQIFFLNCILFPHSGSVPRRYYYTEETDHARLSEISEIIFYEMPKLERKVRDILAGKADTEALSEEEKWCIYFRYRHEGKAAKLIEKLCRKEEGIMRAERAAAKIDRDYEKYARKMAELKNSMEAAARRNDAKREGLIEGMAQGISLGVSEGRVKGLAEGRAEGRVEGILEVARKMKEMGEPVEKIQTFTGLSKKTIEQM